MDQFGPLSFPALELMKIALILLWRSTGDRGEEIKSPARPSFRFACPRSHSFHFEAA